jgi:hypothetical protein
MAKPKRNLYAVVGFVVWKGPAVVGVKAAKDMVTQHRGARRDAAPIAERPQQDDLLSDVVGVESDLAAGAPRRQKHRNYRHEQAARRVTAGNSSRSTVHDLARKVRDEH